MKTQQNDPRYQTVTSLVEEHDRMKGSILEIAAISAKLLAAINGALGNTPPETINIPAAHAGPKPDPRNKAGSKPAKPLKTLSARRSSSTNDAVLTSMPNTFTTSMVAAAMEGAVKQARNACCSWVRQGKVKRTAPGEFLKTYKQSNHDELPHSALVAKSYREFRDTIDNTANKEEQ